MADLSFNKVAFPVTRKMLGAWAGERVLRDAESLVENGRVLEARFDPPVISGSLVWNNRPFKTSARVLPDGKVESLCPCRDNKERGLVCPHVVALGLLLMKRATDPNREARYKAERRNAERMAETKEADYMRRGGLDTPGAMPARLVVSLAPDWLAGYQRGETPFLCEIEFDGKRLPADEVPKDVPLAFDAEDESLLFVIEDICKGPAKGRFMVNSFDLFNIVDLRSGRQLFKSGGGTVTINMPRVSSFLKMEMNRETGELMLSVHTELPFMGEGEKPVYVVAGKRGWAYGADNLWPLENVFPEPYHAIYRMPVVIVPRKDVVRFVRKELQVLSRCARVESDITADMFAVEPGKPRFRLAVKGSPASIAVKLTALYGEHELVAAKPEVGEDFGIPDPEDLLRYTVRNRTAERQALALLGEIGFRGELGDCLEPVVGDRAVLNFTAKVIPSLRRRGWTVDIEGKGAGYFESLDYATPVVHIGDSDGGWFEVGFDYEDREGQSISQAEIQRALRKGESFIRIGDRTLLIDSDAVNDMMGVFGDCDSIDGGQAGRFRLPDLYAPFVKSSLDAIDGVDIEATPGWRMRADRHNREMKVEPVQLGEPLDGMLRSYQKEGVNWLRFLEVNGFNGLLADEMGLGKTAQALAWLKLSRHQPEARGKAALLVCPTSLVENWFDEAAKFAPGLRVLVLSGPDRREKWAGVGDADLVVTSYALLRRDVEMYEKYEFSAVMLDEAQHIKNRSTQNAVSAKRIKARHRLVLTGTPVENSVSDLWSIMDFLMPGYLGNHETFRNNYELPAGRGGPDADSALLRLRRKMRPFLLRRLRKEVAKDLPPKIERVSFCTLSPDQQAVYTELLRKSQNRISGMVSKQGFNASRFEILTVIMRLRQVCCHLGLLDLGDLKPKLPSAKLDQFFEILDEAVDGGHRLLVFSQFVSMLQIIRKALDEQGMSYCYLDGSTKDRMTVVKQFNSDRSIPLFLISLKAGGTGLNLVGADTVVHFDPWWNPAVEDQATDRAYRIGQSRTVYNIKLITRGTVEEKVLQLQQQKRLIIDATLEGDEKMAGSLKWEDIQYLLSL